MKLGRIEYDEIKEDYFLEGQPDAARVKEVAGAFGWMDLGAKDAKAMVPWFICGALFADDTIGFLAETRGPLYECAQNAIPMKDDLMIGRVYVDDTEVQMCQDLRRVDGLFAYKTHKKPDVLDRPRYISPPRTWPTFRGRNRLAKLSPIPEIDLVNYNAGYDRLVAAIANRTTWLHPNVPELQKLRARKLHEIINHPGLKAMIWLHNGLVRSRLHKDGAGYGAAPYYQNMGRR